MSLPHLAEHIRAQGRGEDSMLIHMTPKEVAGLQALAKHHGGSLTINPKTGLPEAGFLSKILPILAGVGLSFVPGVGPLAAAALVGGGGALATGSLSKGLMMGLGAFGGAGLAGGIAAAGITSLAGAGGAAAGAEGALASGVAAEGAAAANALPSAAQLSAMSNAAAPSVANNAAGMAMGQRVAANVLPNAAQALQAAPIQGTPNAAETFMSNARNFPGALSKAVQNPMNTINNMPGPFGGQVNTAMYGSAALAPAVMGTNMRYKMPQSDSGEGNSIDMPKLSSDFYSQPMYSGAPNPIQYPYKTHFNSGGITSLGSYSDGGQLAVGPGDGMSDSIPARMSSGQEARLTDGEFVVPADVVSGLGNGSTKAGSALLYNMLDKVRKARTGKKTQPKAAPMHRMLPA